MVWDLAGVSHPESLPSLQTNVEEESVYTPEEEALMLKHLEELGYID